MKKSKRKFLGQHFLADRKFLKKIVKVILSQKGELVIEIGAGKGALTRILAPQVNQIIAVEKDPQLLHFLEKLDFPNLSVLNEDILSVPFKELVGRNGKSKKGFKVVGNLPYSISSSILFKALDEIELIASCIFLLQKEVAQRICAHPGSKQYAPLSIFFQNYFSPRLHFIVPPEAFSPPPQVYSALISLQKRIRPLFEVQDEKLFRNFVKRAFTHRRKYLFNNLKLLNFDLSLIKDAFFRAELGEKIRPEQVPLSQFVELYRFLYSTQKK